jgi:protein O-mannosyl-transferase
VSWDDNVTLTGNTAFRGFGAENIQWMFTNTLLGHYMPLTWLSFSVSYALGGMDPRGFHLANLLLNALNAALVTLLAWRLIDAAGACGTSAASATRPALATGAMVAGLAFGIHPLHAEPVAWATDRGDVLCGTFYLLALLSYCRGVDEGDGLLRWRPWGVLALLAMAGAVLSKEIGVTLPAALLILDAYPLKRPDSWPRRIREKLPFLALALAGAVVAVAARAAGAHFSTFAQYGPGGRIALFAYSLWYYAATFVAPSRLAPYHEPPTDVSLLVPTFFVAAVGVVAVTIVAVLLRRRWPGGITAWAYYVAVLVPVSGLVHSGSHLVAERYAYLPTVGFAILLGGGAAALARRWRTRRWAPALLVGMALILAGWAILAWRHSASWQDTFTMWRVSAAADPNCGLCALNLAAAYFNAGRPAEAEAWSRRAIELWPGRGSPHHRLGAALLVQDRNAEAERELLEAIRLAPGLAEAHRELGRLYARAGRTTEASGALERALLLGAPRAEVETMLRKLGRSTPLPGRLP